MCARAVGGTTPGLWVTSASSCASDSAARAAASRPPGPSTKALRKASAAASLANAPLSRARSIQSRGQLLHRCVVQQIDCRDGDQFQSSEGDVGVHAHPRGRPGSRGATPARPPRTHPSPVRCSPAAADRWPRPEGPRWVAGHALSVRSPAGGGRWRPTRRTRLASSAESSASLAARGSSGRNRRAAATRAEAASATCPRCEPDPALQLGWPARSTADRAGLGGLGQQGVGSVDRPREQVGLRC